jgi:replication factor A1
MQQTKDEIFKELQDLLSKTEFKKKIQQYQNDFDNLIDEDTSALLLLDEYGRNKQNICNINDLHPGVECTISGIIHQIDEVRTFSRKNGSTGKVSNLEISDKTGSCKVVLWNKDVDLITNNTIQLHNSLRIINGYVKSGRNGMEMHVGRWGMIEVSPSEQENQLSESPPSNTIKGTITAIEPTRSFIRDNGDFGFVTTLTLQNKQGNHKITLWDKKVKEIQQFTLGENIEINNIDQRQENGFTKLHVNGKSIIKRD